MWHWRGVRVAVAGRGPDLQRRCQGHQILSELLRRHLSVLQCLIAGCVCRQEIAAGDWWSVRDLLRQAKDLSSKGADWAMSRLLSCRQTPSDEQIMHS